MSNQERILNQGHLAELREKLERLTDRAEGIVESLRVATYVAPLSTPFDLDAAKVRNFGDELVEVVREGNRVREEIRRLEEALGRR
ncbi:MAG: hypothetical protein AAGE65_03525 [Planctomycetota bacterium]